MRKDCGGMEVGITREGIWKKERRKGWREDMRVEKTKERHEKGREGKVYTSTHRRMHARK